MDARGIAAVFLFEAKRTVTTWRLFCALVLISFPSFVFAMIESTQAETVVALLYVLVPNVVCLMGLLLWATPLIHSELEGKTWVYLAVKPNGKTSLLLGKYLTAVCWSSVTGILSASLALMVANPRGALEIWAALVGIICLSSMSYGALYVLLGVLFLRRAMVFAIGYTLLIEVGAGFVPATVNKLTIQFRTRSLGMSWMLGSDLYRINNSPDGFFSKSNPLFSNAPSWQHLLVLFGMTFFFLAASVAVLRRRELVISEDL